MERTLESDSEIATLPRAETAEAAHPDLPLNSDSNVPLLNDSNLPPLSSSNVLLIDDSDEAAGASAHPDLPLNSDLNVLLIDESASDEADADLAAAAAAAASAAADDSQYISIVEPDDDGEIVIGDSQEDINSNSEVILLDDDSQQVGSSADADATAAVAAAAVPMPTISGETAAWAKAAAPFGATAHCVDVQKVSPKDSPAVVMLISVRLAWSGYSDKSPRAALEIGVLLQKAAPRVRVAYCWPQPHPDSGRSCRDGVAIAALADLMCALVEQDSMHVTSVAASRAKLDALVARFNESDYVSHDVLIKSSSTVVLSDDEELKRQAEAALRPYLEYLASYKAQAAQKLHSDAGSSSSSSSSSDVLGWREDIAVAANFARLNVLQYCFVCGRCHDKAGLTPRTCANFRCVSRELNDARFVDLHSTLWQNRQIADFLVGSTLEALKNTARRASTIGSAPDVYKADPAASSSVPAVYQYPGGPRVPQPASAPERYNYSLMAEELAYLQSTVSFSALCASNSNTEIRAVLTGEYVKFRLSGTGLSSSSALPVNGAAASYASTYGYPASAAAAPAPIHESVGNAATRITVMDAVRASPNPIYNPTTADASHPVRLMAVAEYFARRRRAARGISGSDVIPLDPDAMDVDRFYRLLWWALRRVTHGGTHILSLTALPSLSRLPPAIANDFSLVQSLLAVLSPQFAHAHAAAYGHNGYGGAAAAPPAIRSSTLDSHISNGSLLVIQVSRDEGTAAAAGKDGRAFLQATAKLHSADAAYSAAAAAAAPGPHSHRFSVLVSYLEVYNEQVYDLLSHSAATSGPTSAAAGNGGAAAASSSSSAAAQQQGGGPTDFALMLRGAGAAGGAASNRTAGGGAAPGAIVREPLLIKDGRFVSP